MRTNRILYVEESENQKYLLFKLSNDIHGCLDIDEYIDYIKTNPDITSLRKLRLNEEILFKIVSKDDKMDLCSETILNNFYIINHSSQYVTVYFKEDSLDKLIVKPNGIIVITLDVKVDNKNKFQYILERADISA